MRSALSHRGFILAAAAAFCFSAAARATPGEGVPVSVYEDLNALANQPSTHTGVVFDRSMMQAAENILEQGGLDPDHAATALSTISFDTYRFRRPAFYTPEVMDHILNSYRRAGWKHFVNGNQSPANSAQPASPVLDVWLHFSGMNIDHVSVLIRAPQEMSLVQLAGDLRPLDLLHLSGHFGIPKFDPNAVMVPAPQGR